MKAGKCYLILAVVAGILCGSVTGDTQSPADKPAAPADKLASPAERPVPPIQTNPALVGIQRLYVIVVPLYAELAVQVEQRVAETAIMVLPAPSLGEPFIVGSIAELRINIDLLGPVNMQRYVWRVQTSVAVDVRPQVDAPVAVRSDVWTAGATVLPASPQDEFATVSNLVTEQVEAFISAWLTANRQAGLLPDADGSGAVSPEPATKRARPEARVTAAKYQYLSSKYSKIFHKPDCRWAKRILPKNLAGYNSREEAVKAGKRPCKICKP